VQSFAEEAARQVARRDSGFCTEPHSVCYVITQPSYCLDLAPSDFWLFHIKKMGLKGTRLATMEDITSNPTAELLKIPQEAFSLCF
jgi:hypothetical protein